MSTSANAVAAQRARVDSLRADMARRYGLTTQADAEAATRRADRASPAAAGLLCVIVAGGQGYPGFYFTGEHIRSGWASLIQPLRDAGWNDDEIALWFVAPNGWLDGQRPADLLDAAPDAVRSAIASALEPAGT